MKLEREVCDEVLKVFNYFSELMADPFDRHIFVRLRDPFRPKKRDLSLNRRMGWNLDLFISLEQEAFAFVL